MNRGHDEGLAQAPHGKQGFYKVSGNTAIQLPGETGETIYVLILHHGKWTQSFWLKRDPCDERLMSTNAKANWDK